MRITLQRKDKGNAIDKEMMDGLLDALVELHKGFTSVRMLEVKADGDVFCSGLDKSLKDDDEQVQRLLFLFDMLPMVTVGIVQGPASGFGVALCATFDHICMDANK